MRSVAIVFLVLSQTDALRYSGEFATTRLSKNSTVGAANQQPVTFQNYYYGHEKGRGIWKWSNSLDAYQKHLAPLAGKPLNLVEIGVQSGGSIEMWHAVLGAKCHVYGIDINQACTQFADAATTITIGDQADNKMWDAFYADVVAGKGIDVLIDDGGHEAHQMGITLHRAFPHTHAGGFIAIEDIHGRHYTQSFFFPAALSVSAWHAKNEVEFVEVRPFMFIVKKAGGQASPIPQIAATVNEFPQLWAALNQHPGKFVAVENPAWGSFLSEPALKGIFSHLAPMHDSSTHDTPPGCSTTAASVCTNAVQNSQSQAQMLSVTIYPTKFIVEVAAKPPTIQAVRRGTEWLAYGL